MKNPHTKSTHLYVEFNVEYVDFLVEFLISKIRPFNEN